MDLSDALIQQLQADPIPTALQILEKVIQQASDAPGWSEIEYESLTDVVALLMEAREAGLLRLPLNPPNVGDDITDDCQKLYNYSVQVRNHLEIHSRKETFEIKRGRFRTVLGNSFAYQFSSGDLDRVQELINDLREQIAAHPKLEEEHRQRLLRRLEKLQSELHKKMSDLDRFWGLIGDAGVVLGKLGTDAKPIVDRIREVADIVWQTQARAEELPSGTQPPLLEHKPPEA